MVVYAAIPTRGLPKRDALDYSKLLTFAAGPGQHPGTAQGDLAPGYLPMTKANGLAGHGFVHLPSSFCRAGPGGQAAASSQCGTSVASQQFALAVAQFEQVVEPNPTTVRLADPGSARCGWGRWNGVPTSTPTNRSSTATQSSAAPTKSTSAEPSSSVALSNASQVAARTPALGSNLSAIVLPGLLGAALVAGFLVAALRVRPRGKRAP